MAVGAEMAGACRFRKGNQSDAPATARGGTGFLAGPAGASQKGTESQPFPRKKGQIGLLGLSTAVRFETQPPAARPGSSARIETKINRAVVTSSRPGLSRSASAHSVHGGADTHKIIVKRRPYMARRRRSRA